jgi:hypothetical protein
LAYTLGGGEGPGAPQDLWSEDRFVPRALRMARRDSTVRRRSTAPLPPRNHRTTAVPATGAETPVQENRSERVDPDGCGDRAVQGELIGRRRADSRSEPLSDVTVDPIGGLKRDPCGERPVLGTRHHRPHETGTPFQVLGSVGCRYQASHVAAMRAANACTLRSQPSSSGPWMSST